MTSFTLIEYTIREIESILRRNNVEPTRYDPLINLLRQTNTKIDNMNKQGIDTYKVYDEFDQLLRGNRDGLREMLPSDPDSRRETITERLGASDAIFGRFDEKVNEMIKTGIWPESDTGCRI